MPFRFWFFSKLTEKHLGSITHLVFPSRSHLLSASEDGSLCLFRARDWAVLKVLRGHKGRVNAVAVHPSGKVALSVGKDKALRMWDLMRGKGVASTKLGKGMSATTPCYELSITMFSIDIQKERQFDGHLMVQNLRFNQVLRLTFMQLYVFYPILSC